MGEIRGYQYGDRVRYKNQCLTGTSYALENRIFFLENARPDFYLRATWICMYFSMWKYVYSSFLFQCS